eukprot:SAG31_NODE_16084_length_723_cov_1.543269_1_plen_187_part_10
MFLHPTSVNSKATTFENDCGFLVFLEQMETTKVFIRDCTTVSAYPLLLFGGQLNARVVGGTGTASPAAEVSVGEDGWIRFRTSKIIARLIEQVREAMEGLLAAKIADPSQDFSVGAAAVVKVWQLVHLSDLCAPGRKRMHVVLLGILFTVQAVVELVSCEGGGVGGAQARDHSARSRSAGGKGDGQG